MERRVRVRFAPSPTGPLHIGGVRTALYNYLFAKKHKGDFILRIEDTDTARTVPSAENYIIESLKWSGIMPNEGVGFGEGPHTPYRQSERKKIYKEYAMKLVAAGSAYYAFDSEEDLNAMRKYYEEEKKSAFAYGPATRTSLKNSLTLSKEETEQKISAGEHYVIRLKVPENESINFSDMIRGDVSVHSSTVDDKVLLKSDGMPTYHLAHIVDDILMQITHVIRGEEWLPSAPAHILINKFLGEEGQMPQYAHLPLLLKPEGNGKLSKRDGDRLGFPMFPLDWTDPVSGETSSGYRERGYYPEAFVNMLAMLGWNAGTEQEIFSIEELAEKFSFAHVHKAGARFDPEKAKWFNEQYLHKKSDDELAERFKITLKKEYDFADNDKRLSDGFLLRAVGLLKIRTQFEHEFIEKGRYLFEAPTQYDEKVIAKKWKPELREFFSVLKQEFEKMSSFTAADTEQTLKELAAKNNLKPGDVLQLFRVVLSGQSAGVDLFPMAELLGKEEVVKRLAMALEKMPA